MAGVTWRYRLDAGIDLPCPELIGVSYSGQWLEIGHCRIVIPEGYAWDGCSPALRLPAGLWIGPWDGPRGTDGRPSAWIASLVHDALCQFRTELVGIDKAATVRLFARHLREYGSPAWMCALYPAAVARFGPQDWR